MSAWTCRPSDGKAGPKIVPPRPRIPYWKGLSADSEEKREPASDIDTAEVDSLKALDPKRPIREATNAPQQTASLFDHLVGDMLKMQRHVETKADGLPLATSA